MGAEDEGPKIWQIIVFLAIIVAILACTALPVILQFHYPTWFGYPEAKKSMVNAANNMMTTAPSAAG